MQNSELFRRGIVVPLDKKAHMALLSNNVDEATNIEFFEFPNDEVFERLWAKGLFENINTELGSMINDYELEIVESPKVVVLRGIVERFRNESPLDADEECVITALEKLSAIAIKIASPVFFVL